MTQEYQRPVTAEGALRLHLNENTAGCSPRVLEAVRALDATQMAFYPDYAACYRDVAAYLDVPESCLVLTNGLDEGILVSAVLGFRQPPAGCPPEAIVVEPTFDMYAITAEACGGRVVHVQPRRDFSFPLEEVLAAVSQATRAIYITSPNNPTGVRIPNEAIRAVAGAVPREAVVFVDEAYHDFCGDTILGELGGLPNVLVGRTFAKAHGLAALRAGALIGTQELLSRIRPIVPPYSLNVCSAAALRAAVADSEYLAWYVEQVRTSRDRFYGFCRRHGFDFWESGANFVLARVGPDAAALTDHLRTRGIYIRNKSADPGCDGCIRVTTGVVAHTEQAIEAMEEFLCGAR